jgi:hypothetical protein
MTASNFYEIQRALGRVEAKVDQLLEQDRGFEQRLAKVEHKVTWFSGAAAVIGTLVGWAVSFFNRA